MYLFDCVSIAVRATARWVVQVVVLKCFSFKV